MTVMLTVKWTDEDVKALAETLGIDPAKAVESIECGLDQLEERTIEAGWNTMEWLLSGFPRHK